MSSQGSGVFRRCGKCSRKVTERRCEHCGHDKSSWTWIADVQRPGQPRKTKMKGGYASQREAKEARNAELAAREAGTFIEPTKLTLAEYLAGWLPAIRGDLKPGSVVNYRHTVRLLTERMGDVRLQQLTRQQVKTFYSELGQTHAAKTVHNHHLILHRALRDAIKDGILTANPAAEAHELRKRRNEMKTWTAGELATFLSAANGDRLYAMWRVAGTTGLRRGELLALRWGDVDLERATARVVRAYVRGDAGLHFGEPKSAASRRMIALDPATVATLRAHRAAQNRERLSWGPAYQDGDLLFARENGAPMDPDSITGIFERRVRELKLPRIRLHDLRHTHATLALSAGIHPKVVQERLGHSSISMTLDTYSHAIPAMQADAADKIAALIEAAG